MCKGTGNIPAWYLSVERGEHQGVKAALVLVHGVHNSPIFLQGVLAAGIRGRSAGSPSLAPHGAPCLLRDPCPQALLRVSNNNSVILLPDGLGSSALPSKCLALPVSH